MRWATAVGKIQISSWQERGSQGQQQTTSTWNICNHPRFCGGRCVNGGLQFTYISLMTSVSFIAISPLGDAVQLHTGRPGKTSPYQHVHHTATQFSCQIDWPVQVKPASSAGVTSRSLQWRRFPSQQCLVDMSMRFSTFTRCLSRPLSTQRPRNRRDNHLLLLSRGTGNINILTVAMDNKILTPTWASKSSLKFDFGWKPQWFICYLMLSSLMGLLQPFTKFNYISTSFAGTMMLVYFKRLRKLYLNCMILRLSVAGPVGLFAALRSSAPSQG